MSDSEDMMQDQDRVEAYKQLKERAREIGFPSVNHALDELEGLMPRITVPPPPGSFVLWGEKTIKPKQSNRL